jgi:SH3-like domain-containing protein
VPPVPFRAALAALAGALLLLTPVLAAAQKGQVGASGFPLPRFVSIKSSKVNVRVGPSLEHDVAWTFVHAGIPVEVTQEFDIWYRVRDCDGKEGWVQKTMLSGNRTAFVVPWETSGRVPMKDKAAGGITTAMLEPKALVNVSSCDGAWCRVSVEGYRGYVEQAKLWGVYPNEHVD